MAHNPNNTWINEHIGELKGRKILIVGDLGVDEYVMGDVRRISPEAPVPIVEVEREDRRLGLAANVAANVLALDSKAFIVGVVGEDSTAKDLAELMKSSGVNQDGLIVDKSRPTTRKLRVLAQNQQVVRVDFEKRKFLPKTIEQEVIKWVEKKWNDADLIVLEDYAKGVLTENLCQHIIQKARRDKKTVIVDPNRTTPLKFYRGAHVIKPNRDEAFQLAGISPDDLHSGDEAINAVGKEILKTAECDIVVMTLGKSGMRIFKDSKVQNIPTFAREVYDVTGAGDTVLASLATALAAGWDIEKSCIFANLAAGVVVGELGCVTCSRQQVLDYIEKIS